MKESKAKAKSISVELSKKISIAVAVLMIGGAVGIALFSGRVVTQFAKRNAENSMASFTKEVEDDLMEIENISSSVNWIALDHKFDSVYVSGIGPKISKYNTLLTNSSISFTPADSLEERVFKSGKSEWSNPYESTDGKGAVVKYLAPLKDSEGCIKAVFSSEVILAELSKKLQLEHFYKGSYSVVMGKNGTFISHPREDFIQKKSILDIADITKDTRLREDAGKMISGEKGFAAIKAEETIAIYGPVYNGWCVALVTPGSEIFGGTVRFQLLLLLIALADMLLIYIVTKRIINRTLLPITEISYAAMNVGKGNFKATIPEVGNQNEMKHLHDALTYMLESINDYIYRLKTTKAENERFESELTIASNIQKQMLRTDFVHNQDVDLFATLKPAKEVGGDMYDFRISDRMLYFAVGDVSGKGVPAALYMAISRSLFHYVSGIDKIGSNNVVASINSTFCSGNESNMFITMFVGRLNLDTGELHFCNAGHNPIIVITPDGKASYLREKANLAAGVFEGFQYEKESITLEKGSRLLIYTDGISEAESADKDQYGEGRLLDFANSQNPQISSEEFIGNLIESVKAFTGDNDQNDDITAMSIKI